MTPPRRRMRSAGITLGLTALMATSLTGCSNDEKTPDNAAICVDPQTQERTDDSNCKDDREYHGSGAGFFWFYMATRGGAFVPPIGGRYNPSQGTYTVSQVRNAQGAPVTVRGALSEGAAVWVDGNPSIYQELARRHAAGVEQVG